MPLISIWHLLGAGVLGDSLGALRDGVLGQLTGEQEPDGGLDLPGGDGRPLVVVGEPGGLGGDALKDVVDERVHDGHCLGRDPSVRVNLLQHLNATMSRSFKKDSHNLVDVDGIRLGPLLPLLFVPLGDCLSSFATLGCGLSGSLGRHP